jgi:hypothetical protein
MANSVVGGEYHKISLKDAITEAKMYLKIKDTSDDDLLEVLAWNAVRKIAPLSSFTTKLEKVDVCNNKAKLPELCLRFLWFIPCGVDGVDENGLAIPTVWSNSFIYVDTPFLTEFGAGFANSGWFTNAQNVVRINNGYLEFANVGGQFFDKIQLAYFGYDTDEDGVFRITDQVKPAVVYRICAEYALINAENPVYQRTQGVFERKAVAARNMVKSVDFKNYFQNNIDQINAMYRAYFYAPLVSRNRSRY